MNIEERIRYMKDVVGRGTKTSSIVTIDGFGFKVVHLTESQRRLVGYSHIIVPFDIDSVHAIRAVHAESEIDVNDTIMTDGGVVFAVETESLTLKIATLSSVIVASQSRAVTPDDTAIINNLCELVYALCEDR